LGRPKLIELITAQEKQLEKIKKEHETLQADLAKAISASAELSNQLRWVKKKTPIENRVLVIIVASFALYCAVEKIYHYFN